MYLDSLPTATSGGATTFPLAEKYQNGMQTQGHAEDSVLLSAQELVWNENIHHTRISTNKTHILLGRGIEQAALDLYHSETIGAPGRTSPLDRGIRVVPRQGHICLFSGLCHDGYPNPRSWHGGESILADGATKNVLTFFYEVPVTPEVSSRAAFGEAVRQRESAFLKFHANGRDRKRKTLGSSFAKGTGTTKT